VILIYLLELRDLLIYFETMFNPFLCSSVCLF